MEEATLTSKSQITLPRAVREAIGATAGDRIRFVPARNGYRLVVIKAELKDLAGVLKGRRSKPLSMAGIRRAVARMGSAPEPRD